MGIFHLTGDVLVSEIGGPIGPVFGPFGGTANPIRDGGGEAETGCRVVPVDPAPQVPETTQAGGIRLAPGVATLAAGRVEDFWTIEPEMLEEVLGMIGRGAQEPAVPGAGERCCCLPQGVGQEEGLRRFQAEPDGFGQRGSHGVTTVGQPVGQDLAVQPLPGITNGPLQQCDGGFEAAPSWQRGPDKLEGDQGVWPGEAQARVVPFPGGDLQPVADADAAEGFGGEPEGFPAVVIDAVEILALAVGVQWVAAGPGSVAEVVVGV